MGARRAIKRVVGLLTAGILISLAIALAAAALRPTDGWPNVLRTGRDEYTEKYKLPQVRLRTSEGDVFIDELGGATHTEVTLGPVWKRTIRPEDEWIYTTYPHPEDVPAQTLAVFGNPRRFEIPYWASRWSDDPRERSVKTSAWGWPWRCVKGTQRCLGDWTPEGHWINQSFETSSFYVRGSGAAGTRFPPSSTGRHCPRPARRCGPRRGCSLARTDGAHRTTSPHPERPGPLPALRVRPPRPRVLFGLSRVWVPRARMSGGFIPGGPGHNSLVLSTRFVTIVPGGNARRGALRPLDSLATRQSGGRRRR